MLKIIMMSRSKTVFQFHPFPTPVTSSIKPCRHPIYRSTTDRPTCLLVYFIYSSHWSFSYSDPCAWNSFFRATVSFFSTLLMIYTKWKGYLYIGKGFIRLSRSTPWCEKRQDYTTLVPTICERDVQQTDSDSM